jgi:hypothetical protein
LKKYTKSDIFFSELAEAFMKTLISFAEDKLASMGIPFDDVVEVGTTQIENLRDYDPKRDVIYKNNKGYHLSTIQRIPLIHFKDGNSTGLIVFIRSSF